MLFTDLALFIGTFLLILGFTGGFIGWRDALFKVFNTSRAFRFFGITFNLGVETRRFWNAFHKTILFIIVLAITFFFNLEYKPNLNGGTTQWTHSH